jgi:hypothetical protein
LIGHVARHFKLDPTDYEDLSDLFAYLDSAISNPPLLFQDLMVVYETFPVFGEFMFPKSRSHLWQLIESTDSPLLLSDALITGKEGVFICQPTTVDKSASLAEHVVSRQRTPTLCLNHRGEQTALIYPLTSL